MRGGVLDIPLVLVILGVISVEDMCWYIPRPWYCVCCVSTPTYQRVRVLLLAWVEIYYCIHSNRRSCPNRCSFPPPSSSWQTVMGEIGDFYPALLANPNRWILETTSDHLAHFWDTGSWYGCKLILLIYTFALVWKFLFAHAQCTTIRMNTVCMVWQCSSVGLSRSVSLSGSPSLSPSIGCSNFTLQGSASRVRPVVHGILTISHNKFYENERVEYEPKNVTAPSG